MSILREDLIPEIRQAMVNDYQLKASSDNKHLQGGLCPDCGKKELWAYYDKPLALMCSRLSKCGFNVTAKDLYPDIFEEFSKRYQPTPAKPNATADAYLQYHRCFKLERLKGWYTQGKYWHPAADKGSETVRFNLVSDGSVYWERIIDKVLIADPETGEKKPRKANFKGGFKGIWWQPPGMSIAPGDRVYLVEGVFDAIALYLNGMKAVALMTCGNYPSVSLGRLEHKLRRKVEWVVALDNDRAGQTFNQKHVKRLRKEDLEASCAMPSNDSSKVDWNDLHQEGKLLEYHFKNYHYWGELLVAESREIKAFTMFNHKKMSMYVFSYKCRMFAVNVDLNAYEKSKTALEDEGKTKEEIPEKAFFTAATIKQIANFDMEFLYIQQPSTGESAQHFIRFDYPNGGESQKLPFRGSVFSSASDFKKGVMNDGNGAHFTGSTKQLDQLYQSWFFKKPRIVRTLDFVGYDKQSGAYIFNKFAVHNGNEIALNEEDFFLCKRDGHQNPHCH